MCVAWRVATGASIKEGDNSSERWCTLKEPGQSWNKGSQADLSSVDGKRRRRIRQQEMKVCDMAQAVGGWRLRFVSLKRRLESSKTTTTGCPIETNGPKLMARTQ